MGIAINHLLAMAEGAYGPRILRPGVKVLDFGAQNLYHGYPEDYMELVYLLNPKEAAADRGLALKCIDYAKRSLPDAQGGLLYLDELMQKCGIDYTSLDLDPKATRRFDFNTDKLKSSDVGAYDLILNCGTTEHVFDQVAIFRAIHDATKHGGLIYHAVPTTGSNYHCLYKYDPKFFLLMAAANGYDILYAGFVNLVTTVFDQRHATWGRYEIARDIKLPSIFVEIIYRKVHDNPFGPPIDLANTHPTISHVFDQPLKDPLANRPFRSYPRDKANDHWPQAKIA